MPAYVVGTVDEIPVGGRKIVEVAGRSIGIFNVAGEYVALRNRCPHQGGPLCLGVLTGSARVRPWSVPSSSASPQPAWQESSRKASGRDERDHAAEDRRVCKRACASFLLAAAGGHRAAGHPAARHRLHLRYAAAVL